MIVTESTTPISFGNGTIRICRRGTKNSILLVALSRPKQYNAFNDAVYEDLVDIMRHTAVDDTIVAIVLTGTGSYFCSGADLKNQSTFVEPKIQNGGGGRNTVNKPAGKFMISLLKFPKIFAAAVNGPAVGIGVTLLLHCDIVYCSPTATFWTPFTRLALVPELCSSVTFIETFGLSKANELLLLGKTITAQTAYEWNLCSKVVSNHCDVSGDPFTPTTSVANILCTEIDTNVVVSIPLGDRTASYFVSLMKGSTHRRQRMEQICYEELLKLDERFDSGQVQEAFRSIDFGSTKKKKKSLPSKL